MAYSSALRGRANPHPWEFSDTTFEVATKSFFRGSKKDFDLVMRDSVVSTIITPFRTKKIEAVSLAIRGSQTI